MTRRFVAAALTIAIASGAVISSSRESSSQAVSCLVTTTSGDVQGTDLGPSCAFLGIPFAAPPLGDLRWRPPQPATPWAPATLNATGGLPCPNVNPPGTSTTAGTEDCLKLNIWTPDPAPASPAPVIVWIHTGAFQAASANLPDSNGRKMAEQTGAIVVAANYRVGPFGFIGHRALTAEDPAYRSSGNYGFLDQRAALAWVRDHIAAFGGDPNNLAIAGQSAGGHSVSLHMVSPGSAGYFNRAIIQSSYASTRWPTLADAEALGDRLASTLGCTDPSQVLACLRSKTPAQVLLAFPNGQQEFAETAARGLGTGGGWTGHPRSTPDPVRGVARSTAYRSSSAQLRDEGWIYVDRSFPAGLTVEQYEAAVATEFGAADAPAILAKYPVADFPSPKHALIAVDRRRRNGLRSAQGRPPGRANRDALSTSIRSSVRRMQSSWTSSFTGSIATSSLATTSVPRRITFSTQTILRSLAAISGYWTRFAATGNPNSDGHGDAVRWPAFKHPGGRRKGADKYIILDWPVREDKRLREEHCDFWEPFFLKSIASGPETASQPFQRSCAAPPSSRT